MLPFEVKHPELITDPVRGYAALHPDLKAVLSWLCDHVHEKGWALPVVTCFGRTRDDQEEIYFETYLEELGDPAVARIRARGRFSWHCISADPMPSVRAFDLRDWIYAPSQRVQIMFDAHQVFPDLIVLDHAVPGGARHFHFERPDPAGKPHSWR